MALTLSEDFLAGLGRQQKWKQNMGAEVIYCGAPHGIELDTAGIKITMYSQIYLAGQQYDKEWYKYSREKE